MKTDDLLIESKKYGKKRREMRWKLEGRGDGGGKRLKEGRGEDTG